MEIDKEDIEKDKDIIEIFHKIYEKVDLKNVEK